MLLSSSVDGSGTTLYPKSIIDWLVNLLRNADGKFSQPVMHVSLASPPLPSP